MFYENPNLTIKLFDSLVKPVLLYASDFWGYFEFASSDKSPLEKLNTTLCKYLLGAKKQVSNVASKIEMGILSALTYFQKPESTRVHSECIELSICVILCCFTVY